MGMLRVLSRHGDDRVAWDLEGVKGGDPEALAAVQEAERIFQEQKAHGATAFQVVKGHMPSRIDQFDMEVEQIVLVPRVVGG